MLCVNKRNTKNNKHYKLHIEEEQFLKHISEKKRQEEKSHAKMQLNRTMIETCVIPTKSNEREKKHNPNQQEIKYSAKRQIKRTIFDTATIPIKTNKIEHKRNPNQQ